VTLSGADERGTGPSPRQRSPVFRAIVGTLAVVFFLIFVALGTWQVKRRVWKLDLIARVEQRVHAPAAPAPRPAEWSHVTAAADEYRHVTATGTYLDDAQTLVQAVTDLGAGYWVLTPLREADGSVVLVNRGFVASDDRWRVKRGADDQGRVTPAGVVPATPFADGSSPTSASTSRAGTHAAAGASDGAGFPTAAASTDGAGSPAAAASTDGAGSPAAAASTVTGLLRITEPDGAFLRHNNPAANLWYSRDVQAIAAARGLSRVAPYFIDAQAPPHDAAAPRALDSPHSAAPTARAASTEAFDAAHDAAPRQPDTAHAASPGATDAPRAAALPGADTAAAAVAPTPGLTVIHFHNSHLVYAITWYTLALMTAIAIPLGMRKQ
jgi:surfeit locus 1 family protein